MQTRESQINVFQRPTLYMVAYSSEIPSRNNNFFFFFFFVIFFFFSESGAESADKTGWLGHRSDHSRGLVGESPNNYYNIPQKWRTIRGPRKPSPTDSCPYHPEKRYPTLPSLHRVFLVTRGPLQIDKMHRAFHNDTIIRSCHLDLRVRRWLGFLRERAWALTFSRRKWRSSPRRGTGISFTAQGTSSWLW